MKPFAPFTLLILAACTAVPFKERPAVALAPALTEGGSTVYFGSSFPRKGTASAPSFIYERRVEERDGALVSTHITRDPSGALAVVDSATHSADYDLADYALLANQVGQTGSVHVEGDQVRFRLVDEGGERTRVEHQREPVVVGPTLVGFIYKHLEALRGKQVFAVRFAVLDRLETIGFELKAVEAPAGQTRVKMSASSFILALAIDPLFFTFESATGKLVRMEGRIPPRVRSGQGWADFDARVEYRFVADAYR